MEWNKNFMKATKSCKPWAMFRLCLLHLPSLQFIILLEHKDADVELEEEIQSVLHEALHSQPGNALTVRTHWRIYK